MNPSLNDELLDRYLADEVTLAERGAVEAWIAQRPERASILEAARAALGSDSPAFDAGQA